MKIITLTTDFGLNDEYVGVMKGVLACRAPEARVIDICHAIAPQNILDAAEMVAGAYGYFPKGTVHLIVVDPGVGSGRGMVAAEADGHLFVAPDNGLLPAITKKAKRARFVRITRDDIALEKSSTTFHGRDLFSPLAAHLVIHEKIDALGPEVSLFDLTEAPEPPIEFLQNGIRVQVTRVDRFGNIITPLSRKTITKTYAGISLDDMVVEIGQNKIKGLLRCYADGKMGEPLVLFGSRETLEVAVNGGDASKYFGISAGDWLTIRFGNAQKKMKNLLKCL